MYAKDVKSWLTWVRLNTCTQKTPTADLKKTVQLPDEVLWVLLTMQSDDYLEGKDVAEKDAIQIDKLFRH